MSRPYAPHPKQRLAADPTLSAFVSANAGSGKTSVLVDRVVRLMLAGAAPAKILCLTYTKAAAANMAVRVFERLGAWVAMDDTALADALERLEGQRPNAAHLAAARRLFARAVETPGGLKIETIHAFCERLLHLFPFEANVPARFEVLDDAEAEALFAQARRAVLVEASSGLRPDLAAALKAVSLEASGDVFDAALRAAIAERDFIAAHPVATGDLARAMDGLAGRLGLMPGESVADIERAMLEDGLPPADWPDVIATLSAGKATDRERAEALRKAKDAPDQAVRVEAYLDVFFKQNREPRADSRFVTQSIDPHLVEALRAERDRLVPLLDRRRAARTVARTQALFKLAAAIHARVAAAKVARGALDFDDLIAKTRVLLTRLDAGWVLYKLDAGIDHVLVDEAQDTNPAQWDILKALTAEFMAGLGARDGRVRTIFAVGDPKQSIYGFQGAAPREFEASGAHYRRLISAAEQRFEAVELQVSYRSAPEVLKTVDAVFAVEAHYKGLAFGLADSGQPGTVHESNRRDAPGRVEIWPLVRPVDQPKPTPWTAPLDTPEAAAPPLVLAARIARAVKLWTSEGDETGQPVSPGEVLILVRKRGALFEAIIRALKNAGVPVAGADRLTLGTHIAVADLIAAGRAALLPDDDLMLANLLKSPLVGLTDDDLIAIAARRGEGMSLHGALRAAAAGRDSAPHEGAARACRLLADWATLAMRGGPFAFYATLLGPGGGRKALTGRLGPEAGDAIDEFLSLALAHEQRETPSLAAFLAGFGDAKHEVKRDMETGGGEVRVMTVHGAKGLEADLVILADECKTGGIAPVLLPLAGENGRTLPVWPPRKAERPAALAAAFEARAELEREEHNRLLYVAMTRARDRLVIAPCIGRSPKDPKPEAWPEMAKAAFDGVAHAVPFPFGAEGETMLMRQSGTPDTLPGRSAPALAPALPDWLDHPAPAGVEMALPLAASSALRDDAVRGGGGANARRAGTLIHLLIERLPARDPARRHAAGLELLDRLAPDLPPAEAQALVDEALAVFALQELAGLFGPDALAEAPVAGCVALPGGREVEVTGRIDRLLVTPHAIVIADFKAGQPPAGDAAPLSALGQLALYRALLAQAFPGRVIEALLVWTKAPRTVRIAPDLLDAAMAALAAQGASALADEPAA
jgi:ATP-dependent helicase/nuclease subunit A